MKNYIQRFVTERENINPYNFYELYGCKLGVGRMKHHTPECVSCQKIVAFSVRCKSPKKNQGDLHDTKNCNTAKSETLMVWGKYTDYLV